MLLMPRASGAYSIMPSTTRMAVFNYKGKAVFKVIYTVLSLFISLSVIIAGPGLTHGAERDCTLSLADSLLVIDINKKAWAIKSTQPDRSCALAIQAHKLAKDIGYEAGIATALHTQAMALWYQGEINTATDLFFKALAIREQQGDQLNLGRSYNNIGNAFYERRRYGEAFRYYEKGLRIRERIKDSLGLVYSYSNIADVYTQRRQYELARVNYHKGLRISQSIAFREGSTHVSDQLGHLFLLTEIPDSARHYYQYALNEAESAHDEYSIASAITNLVQLRLNEPSPDWKSCLLQIQRARLLACEAEAPDLEKRAAKLMADIQARLGNYKEAYLNHLAYVGIETSQLNSSNEQSLLYAEMRYKAAQEASKQHAEEWRRERNLYLALLAVVALSLISFILLGRNSFNRARYQQNMAALRQEKQKQVEQHNQVLVKKNQALEQFMFALSHDLKEPLRSISSFSGLLERRYKPELDERGRQYLQFIIGAVHQMYQVLEDTLTFSHLARQDEAKRERADINDIVQRTLQSLGALLNKHEAEVRCLPLPVMNAQPEQIQQLFAQLIGNAIKFRGAAIPHIEIGAKQQPNDYLFWVKDNGIGIEADFFEKIFTPFHRLNKQDYDGTGLGLAICRQIVHQHGGRIWVESEIHKGSTFFFTLPLSLGLYPEGEAAAHKEEVSLLN